MNLPQTTDYCRHCVARLYVELARVADVLSDPHNHAVQVLELRKLMAEYEKWKEFEQEHCSRAEGETKD